MLASSDGESNTFILNQSKITLYKGSQNGHDKNSAFLQIYRYLFNNDTVGEECSIFTFSEFDSNCCKNIANIAIHCNKYDRYILG